MSNPDVPHRTVGHGTDTDEERGVPGGAMPTGEPREQDSAHGGRLAGLGVTTIIGILLIAVPLIWAFTYFAQADTAGLGTGFTFLVGIVVGGLASVTGPIFGAFFIQFVPNWAQDISKAAPWAIYGVFLIFFMYVMPRGVAGTLRMALARAGRRGTHPGT